MNDEIFHSTAPIEISAGDAGASKAPRSLKIVAYTGGAMKVAQLSHPIVIDLNGFDAGASPRPILIDHEADFDSILGQTERIEIKAGNVIVTGKVFGDSEKALRVVAMNDKGFMWQASLGFSAPQREFIAAGQKVSVNGKTLAGPLTVARKSFMGEVSLVPLGADDSTTAQIAAKNRGGKFKMDDTNNAAAGTITGDSVSAELEAERKRADDARKIETLTARSTADYPDRVDAIHAMQDRAFQAGWDAQRFELELLRAMRPQSQALRFQNNNSPQLGRLLETGLCLAAGLSGDFLKAKCGIDERTIDAATHGPYQNLSFSGLQKMILATVGRDHPTLTGQSLFRASLEAHQGGLIRASAVSNLSLPGILGNVANKVSLQSFMAVESTWRAIAAVRPVSNFKEVSTYSLTGDFTYRKLPPGGKIEHAQVGEEGYTNQADSFARMFAVDRRDIINDDLGALTQIPRRLGRGGALKFNSVFWGEFLDNSTFFTSGNANYLEGATPGTNDTRMNIEGITRAETTFFNQTDPDGNPMALTPRIMLVPGNLNAPAANLMNSTEIRDTTASTVFPTGNPHQGKFTVVRSTYLSSSSLTGYSVLAWYLLADPNEAPVIEVVFLNGLESPTLESDDADFNSLGMQFRAWHDFGARKQEPRAGVKMKGAA
jgi:phage major head subunit gpT-like protein